MTSREWRADRRAVFERDDYACRHCGAAGGPGSPTELRTHPVCPVPTEETVHESVLVTVCEACFCLLHGATTDDGPIDPRAFFDTVREITQVQAGSIADVADFAATATALPDDLLEGTLPPYDTVRRDVVVTLDIADAHLDAVERADRSALASDADPALEAFLAASRPLQGALRDVVVLVETVVDALYRCHVCFASLEEGSSNCGTCRAESRSTAEWQADGRVRYDALFSTITETLQTCSERTDVLSNRASTLAETLVGPE